MLDLQAVPIPNDEFGVREVGDEILFLTKSGTEVVNLNPVGTFIWRQFDGNHTLQDVLDIICEEYEVEPDRAEEDLRSFVAELETNKLVLWQKSGT